MLNGLDLFSGIGGISLALKPWVRTVAYCEVDRYCQGVLLSRMQSGELSEAPIWAEVKDLPNDALIQIAEKFLNESSWKPKPIEWKEAAEFHRRELTRQREALRESERRRFQREAGEFWKSADDPSTPKERQEKVREIKKKIFGVG